MNTTMNTKKKQTIRLSETQLRQMISESVKRALYEGGAVDGYHYGRNGEEIILNKDYSNYLKNKMIKDIDNVGIEKAYTDYKTKKDADIKKHNERADNREYYTDIDQIKQTRYGRKYVLQAMEREFNVTWDELKNFDNNFIKLALYVFRGILSHRIH